MIPSEHPPGRPQNRDSAISWIGARGVIGLRSIRPKVVERNTLNFEPNHVPSQEVAIPLQQVATLTLSCAEGLRIFAHILFATSGESYSAISTVQVVGGGKSPPLPP